MLWWMLQTSVVAAALIAVVAAACRLGRLRPSVQHALWLAVLVKLATPNVVTWPWSVEELATALYHSEDVDAGRADESDPETRPFAEMPGEQPAAPLTGNDPYDSTTTRALTEDERQLMQRVLLTEGGPAETRGDSEWISAAEHTASAGSAGSGPLLAVATRSERNAQRDAEFMTVLLLAVWLCGAAVYVALQCRRIVQFRRKLRGACDVPDWLHQSLRKLSAELHLQAPRVLVSRDVASPCLWCLGSPRLIWPEWLTDDPRPARWQGIIVHELAHLKRRDHWVAWLELVVGCVWWWNPLYWFVRRQLRETADLACDAWAVWIVADGERAYAESLLEITKHLSRVPLAAPLLGASHGARRSYQRRIEMIMSPRVPCRVSLLGVLCAGLLAALSAPAWSLDDSKLPSAPATDASEAPALPTVPASAGTPTSERPASSGRYEDDSVLDEDDSRSPARTGSESETTADANAPLMKPSDAERLEWLERQIQALAEQLQANAARGDLRESSVRRRSVPSEAEVESERPSLASAGFAGSSTGGLVQSLAGAPIDLIRLATEYSDAAGAKKLNEHNLRQMQALANKHAVTESQLMTATVNYETASNKVALLRAIAEATAVATREDLEFAVRMVEKGYAAPSSVSQLRAKMRVISLLLDDGAGDSTRDRTPDDADGSNRNSPRR